MDSLINKLDNVNLNSKNCSVCTKIIYNNTFCRECFLNYLAFMDMKECCTCGSIFKPFSEEHTECDSCLKHYT
jgi:hypothetical protein